MIVTEDEAKTKRCHQSMGFEKQPAYPSHCIGSACMAWRWVYVHTELGGFAAIPASNHVAVHGLDPSVPVGGYCGKAGRP